MEEAPSPDAVWESDPETLVLATTGRLAAGEALARTKVEGDAAMLEALIAAWASG
jgi:hypothetical protein